MSMHMLNIFLKILITFLLIFFVNITSSFADPVIIKKIIVNGEKRLSESFILNFLPNYPNTKISDEVVNKFTVDLYKTDLFSNINLIINNNILEINVT